MEIVLNPKWLTVITRNDSRWNHTKTWAVEIWNFSANFRLFLPSTTAESSIIFAKSVKKRRRQQRVIMALAEKRGVFIFDRLVSGKKRLVVVVWIYNWTGSGEEMWPKAASATRWWLWWSSSDDHHWNGPIKRITNHSGNSQTNHKLRYLCVEIISIADFVRWPSRYWLAIHRQWAKNSQPSWKCPESLPGRHLKTKSIRVIDGISSNASGMNLQMDCCNKSCFKLLSFDN